MKICGRRGAGGGTKRCDVFGALTGGGGAIFDATDSDLECADLICAVPDCGDVAGKLALAA